MEHTGECSHRRLTEVVNDTIWDPYLILDIEMELLQVGGPILMELVLWFPLRLYELHRLVISVDDRLLSHNVMFPLTTWLYNGIHFLVIGGLFLDNIWECLTMICHQMTMLNENCAYNIVICITLNLKWLFQIEQGESWSWAQAMLQIIKFLLLFLPPHELLPSITLGHLGEGPCNMGESQDKSSK